MSAGGHPAGGASPQGVTGSDPWTWGFNGNGQIGNGTTTSQLSPQQVAGLGPVVSLAGGRYHSLAAKADGTVWAWGYNGDGELGDGTTTNHPTPEQAGAGSGMAGMTLDATGAWRDLAAFTTAKPQVTAYGYDRPYELTSVRGPGTETSYAYDPVGNRASVTSGGQTTSYTYDKADRLGVNGYVTDANGNLHQGPSVQFQYDSADRLAQAQVSGGQVSTITYNGNSDRVGRGPVQVGGDQYTVADVNDVNGGLPNALEEAQCGQGPGGSYNETWKFV